VTATAYAHKVYVKHDIKKKLGIARAQPFPQN